MKTLGKFIKVRELQDDFMIDGLLQKYDDSSPFMFGVVIGGNDALLDELSTCSNYGDKIIISFRRVAKVPYLNCYLVSKEDVIDVMTESEYEDIKKGVIR